MRLSTASVFVVHLLLMLVLCGEARLGGFDRLGFDTADVILPVSFQRRILEEQVILTDSKTAEAEVKEVKENNAEPKAEDKPEEVKQQKKEEDSKPKENVEQSEEKKGDQWKPPVDSKVEKEEQWKAADEVKEEKKEEQTIPAKEAKDEKKEEQWKPPDEVQEEKKEDQRKPADGEKEEKKNEGEDRKPSEESKEEVKVEKFESKADEGNNQVKTTEERKADESGEQWKPSGESKEEGKKDKSESEQDTKSDEEKLATEMKAEEMKTNPNVEQKKEDKKAGEDAADEARKDEERKMKKEKEMKMKAEKKEELKLKEKEEKAKAQERKEAAKAKEKNEEVKKKEDNKKSKDEGADAAGHAQIEDSKAKGPGSSSDTSQAEHKAEEKEKIEVATLEVKDSESTPKVEENRSKQTDGGDKSEEQSKKEASQLTSETQYSGKQSEAEEGEDTLVHATRTTVTDADEDYPDFLEELRNFPERFQRTAESVKDHIRYSGLDLNRYSTHSKELFNQANHQIEESFTPLLGKDYAPAIAYVVSYGLLLLPLALVMYLLDRVRAIFSLQKVLFFINIYLSAYFAALLAAAFILDSEPMAFFMKYSSSSYVFLQLLQAFGYLAYLLLNTIDLLSTCSGGRVAAKFSASVQFFVVVAVGFHYYVTVFHRAMERKAPITSWKVYGLYSASFFFLCLFARIERGKKQYPPVEQDDETDKKN